MTSLKTSIKTITYLSDIGCLEIQGASLLPSQPCQMLSQIQIMSLNALSVTLADNVQLSLQA